MILILGHRGSMGTRYCAILDSLKIEWLGLDSLNGPITNTAIVNAAKKCSGIIICTPTDSHEKHLMLLAELQLPVLCEKPICKNLDTLARVLLKYKENFTPLSMVMQYRELLNDQAIGPSWYDYFRSGKDGLYWDCLQIIALAEGSVRLENKSPVWDCCINGQTLNSKDMDQAYVWNIQRWLNGEKQSLKELYAVHQRVHEFTKADKSSNRNSG